MKLRESRKCVRKPPPAPSRKRKGILKLRMPRPLLRVNVLQRRRYHSTVEVKIKDCATIGDLKESIAVQKNLSVVLLLYRGIPLDDARLLGNFLPDLRIGCSLGNALPGFGSG